MGSKPESNFSSDDQVMISLQDVRKQYGRRSVLHIPEFSVHAGDTVALLGKNGSGKSTLLRLLAGITRQTSGKIYRSDLWRHARIGIVPQAGGINLSLTVAENILMYRRLYDRSTKVELCERPLVQDFGLSEFLQERAGNLSGGFQRIVSIVGALDVAPDGLLMDEPLSGLDRHHSEILLRVITERVHELKFFVVTGHGHEHLPTVQRHVTLIQGVPQ